MVPGGVVNAYRVEHDRVDAGELLKEHETDGDAHRLQVSLAKDVGQLELSFACKLTRQLDGLNKIAKKSCIYKLHVFLRSKISNLGRKQKKILQDV